MPAAWPYQNDPTFAPCTWNAADAGMQTDELMTAKRPKADDTDDNPAAKKRNRRMFGFLNQTLQKSK